MSVYLKSPQCFNKKDMGKKLKKAEQDLKLGTSKPRVPTTWEARYKKINQVTHLRNSGRGRGRLLTSISFISIF